MNEMTQPAVAGPVEPTVRPGALAPCPFCGAVPGLFMNLVLQLTFWRSGWHITCTRCGAEGPKRVTRDRARASWNLRA